MRALESNFTDSNHSPSIGAGPAAFSQGFQFSPLERRVVIALPSRATVGMNAFVFVNRIALCLPNS